MQINFSNQQLTNLISFLNRVQLQGNEAAALVEVQLILRQSIEAMSQKKEVKKDEEKK